VLFGFGFAGFAIALHHAAHMDTAMKTRRMAARQQAIDYMDGQEPFEVEEETSDWAKDKARNALNASDIRANFGEPPLPH